MRAFATMNAELLKAIDWQFEQKLPVIFPPRPSGYYSSDPRAKYWKLSGRAFIVIINECSEELQSYWTERALSLGCGNRMPCIPADGTTITFVQDYE
jgi:hypothetical protein